MFSLLGRFVARYPLVVMVVWAIAAAAIHWVAPPWDSVTNDGDLAYLPDRMTTVRGERLLAAAFPNNKAKSQLVLVAARAEGPLTTEDLKVLETLVQKVQAEPGDAELPLVGMMSPASDVVGAKLISPDRRAASAVLQLSTEFMAVQNIALLERASRVVERFRNDPALPQGLQLGITGSAAVGGDMLSSAAESIKNTELVTVLLVLAILGIVYRAPLLLLVPVITLVTSVVVACDVVALLTTVHRQPGWEWFDFKVFKTSKIFIITILFGAGTDFCLFLIARYREELRQGYGSGESVARALGNVGAAIAASAMTTVLGLGTMFFASFGKYRNSGPAIGLCLFVALLACLTLAPALLRALGRRVFWPWNDAFGGDPSRSAAATGSNGHAPSTNGKTAPPSAIHREPVTTRFWQWISRQVVHYPGLILSVSLLLMAPFAVVGWDTPVTYNLLVELEPHRPSVVGTALLSQHFPPGETGPVIVLAHKAGAGFDTKAGEQEIARLTKWFYDTADVQSVRSIAEPLGDSPGLSNPFSAAGRNKMTARKHPTTKATYVAQTEELAGNVTRFDLILKHDPFSSAAMATVDELDRRLTQLSEDPESPWHNVRFEFLGTSAATRDLRGVTESDRVLIQQLVTIVVLGILIVLLRKPALCVYLIVSVLFSYFVTLGATHLIFSWWYETYHGLDWKVPIFLFVILVAVGEDYNIFLVTRVVEEQRQRGLLGGLRHAVAQTGGIITSCGVIMAGTLVSMMVGTLRGMQELGFSLSLGIMLDTVVVRPVLVPAFLALTYRWRGAKVDDEPVEAAVDEAVPVAAAE